MPQFKTPILLPGGVSGGSSANPVALAAASHPDTGLKWYAASATGELGAIGFEVDGEEIFRITNKGFYVEGFGKTFWAGGAVVSGVGTPENDSDAATKAYVDANAGGDPGADIFLLMGA